MESRLDSVRAALLGVAVGDALGVPYEFRNREMMRKKPCTGMVGHGTHDQPAGTWSDDTSMTLCLAEALSEADFDLDHLGRLFVRWFYDGYWSPHGVTFDYGGTTAEAIQRHNRGVPAEASGCLGENSNGNGSLMRILPLVFYINDLPIGERYKWTRQVGAITHGHIRSVIACFYHLEFARLILRGVSKWDAYRQLQKDLPPFLGGIGIGKSEIGRFDRLLVGDIGSLPEDEIRSDGYVVHTLEASMCCLLTTECFRDAALMAVNLGGDTDTTGAVVGGLAGGVYGIEGIPEEWLEMLARRKDIEHLALLMTARLGGSV